MVETHRRNTEASVGASAGQVSRIAGLMRPWLAGWIRSRELPAPTGLLGAARVQVAQPDRFEEIVIVDPEQAPREEYAALVALASAPTWLSVPTVDRLGTVADLERHGLTVDRFREWLMSRELADHPYDSPPAGYRLEVHPDPPLVTARAVAGDATIAASGRLARVDGYAVFDQIETDANHRRQGLARAVMGALAAAARDRGAHTGLLVASEVGHHLYERLGWHTRCDVVVGRTPT